ncbi:hypothetical protein PVL29_024405 [Vitis rotundifolia]|uniref:Calcineurin-like phosphoesterase domain-containing protein n=1 Tax=Vitis rotundifolia TaxID=103349 RepID=A0AA38YS06_VITRO|nr:hypothetical protein PVL29_024405 [Vitis rotundifolia]
MNVEGDFRFVTQASLDEFRAWADWFCIGDTMKSLYDGLEKSKNPFVGIHLKFLSMIPFRFGFLSQNQTVLFVGDSVFVHGGLLPNYVRDGINGLKGRFSPGHLRGRHSHVLATIPDAKRMIMGHTIQEAGINGACEIIGNSELRVLTSNPSYKDRPEVDRKCEFGLLLSKHGLRQVKVKAT